MTSGALPGPSLTFLIPLSPGGRRHELLPLPRLARQADYRADVAVPAFNEAQRILPTVAAIDAHLSAYGRSWKVIVSEGGSTHHQGPRLRTLGMANLRVDATAESARGGRYRIASWSRSIVSSRAQAARSASISCSWIAPARADASTARAAAAHRGKPSVPVDPANACAANATA